MIDVHCQSQSEPSHAIVVKQLADLYTVTTRDTSVHRVVG